MAQGVSIDSPETYGSVVWRGLALPILRTKGGYLASKTVADLVWSSVIMTLVTPRNFRPMMPEYGGGLLETIFDQMPEAEIVVRDAIQRQVPKWDPRIIVMSLNVVAVPEEKTVTATVVFGVRGEPGTFQRSIKLTRNLLPVF